MLEIYNHNNINYDYNGDETFTDYFFKGTLELNGKYEIEVEFPYDSKEKWRIITADNVIKCNTPIKDNQLFRIYKVVKDEDSITAYARHVFFDLQNYILMDVRPTLKNGQQALNSMLTGTPFTGSSNISTIETSYFVRMNVLQALTDDSQDNSFISRWGGERLVDNYKIEINSKVGENRGYRVEFGYNMDSIEHDINLDDVVTRIIPEAYNGYLLEDDKPYVDSSLINKYAVVKSKVLKDEFADLKLKEDCNENEEGYNTLEELRAAMKERCKKLFDEGLDKPTITTSINMSMLRDSLEYKIKGYSVFDEIKLGDTINCYFGEIDIDIDERVVSIDWTLDQEGNVIYDNITLGQVENSYFNTQSDISNRVQNILSPNGVKAESIEGIINALNTKFQALRDVAQKQHVRAFKFEDDVEGSPTYGCMVLGTSGFEISNKKDANGDWIFRTFGSGKGFTADEIVAGILTAILIKNADGSFQIDLSKNGGCNFYNNSLKAIEIKNNQISLFNWKKSNELSGTIGATYFEDSKTPAVSWWNNPDSVLTIGYEDGTTSAIHPYIHFDKYGKTGQEYSIQIRETLGMYEHIHLRGYRIVLTENDLNNYISSAVDSNGDHMAWINKGCKVNGTLYSDGLKCVGDKQCIQRTKEYGDIGFSAVEDIGSYLTWREYGGIYETTKSKYSQDNYYSCVVKIPKIIQSTINTKSNYNVEVNAIKSLCNITVWAMKENCFLIKSTEPCKFNFVLTGRRKGFETRSIEEEMLKAQQYQKSNSFIINSKNKRKLQELAAKEWLEYGICYEG